MDARRIARAVAALAAAGVVFGVAAWVDPAMRRAAPSGPLSPEDERGVLFTLAGFQKVYQDFFARGGSPELLEEFPASREVRHQVFRDVGFLRDAGLLQVQDFAGAVLMETRWVERDQAEALVYEEWNHVFQRLADRAPTSQVKGLGQGIRYRLRRGIEGWVVIGWNPVTVARPLDSEQRDW